MERIEILSIDAVSSTAQDYLSDVAADTLKYSIENDGIGPYEFWGSRSYDQGHNHAVIDTDLSFEIACPFTSYDDINTTIVDIKKYVSRTFELGGCIDDHSGRCANVCAEYLVEINVTSINVNVSGGMVIFNIQLG